MLLLSLASVTCTIIVSFLSARTAAGVARDVRHDLFTKVEGFSKAEFEKFSTASLITRSTNDITQIQMVIVMMIRMVFYAPIIGVGAVLQAINKSPSMTWIIALAVAILLAVIIVVFSVSLPKFKRIQGLIDRLNLVTRESLSGMMVIRAFNTQPFEAQRFDKANQDLTQNMLFVSRIMVIMMPFMMLIMNGLSVVIIWVGAHQVANSALQVGDMMAFMQYAIQVVFSFLMLSFMFIILPRASVSAGRVAEVLAVEPSILDPKEPKQFGKTTNGLIEFHDVSFRYPNAEADVLHNLSFTAKPGETTAIIGSTGSGKSTVVNLIPRFFDITEGAILMDGWISARSGKAICEKKLVTSRKKDYCFPAPLKAICATPMRTQTKPPSKRPLRSPRPRSLSLIKKTGFKWKYRRAAATSLAAKNNAWPSPARW
jgi:ATP-binding cassette subfamily B protein